MCQKDVKLSKNIIRLAYNDVNFDVTYDVKVGQKHIFYEHFKDF